ncbi:hypothetical protein QBC38DRAFT_492492 [Podospora fimiseda]|uniref:F-box domain-containing protein n=1 Tax=Podospora fimiseda TaxID=252190 RepID=A0AAN7BF73_9PEZI|nr:hypothetical protein QBC38DRAFT_492492 [Podospora fimiseda]
MATLYSLSIELLDIVAQQLCVHCVPPPSPPPRLRESLSGHWYMDHSNLWSLYLSSRRLRDAATRYLYHYPSLNKVNTWEDLARNTRMQLAKRFVDYKCMARHVKRIRLHIVDMTNLQLHAWDPSVRKYFEGVLESKYGGYQMQKTPDPRLLLVSSLCSNLQELWVPEVSETDLLITLIPPNSMLSLKTLVINSELDPEDGLDLSTHVDLFRAAPNITSLQLGQVRAIPNLAELGVVFNKVKYLAMRSCPIPIPDFRNILRSCPQLETLLHDPGWHIYEPFPPLQVKDAILEDAPNLKSFYFDVSNCYMRDSDDWLDGENEAKETLEKHGIDCIFDDEEWDPVNSHEGSETSGSGTVSMEKSEKSRIKWEWRDGLGYPQGV